MASPIQVQRFVDAAAFLERAADFLGLREAEHNLPLGLATRLLADPHAYGAEDPYLGVAAAGDEVVAVAIRTPPYNVILSEADDERAVAAFVADLRAVQLPGVVGPVRAADQFAQLWARETGVRIRVQVAERIYRASESHPPENVPGSYRAYATRDRGLVVDWLRAFVAESLPPGTPFDAEAVLARRLEERAGGFVLWDDDGPVSLAGFGGATPHGIRVGPVYTPPELRGRGYASALVAELTARLLADDRQFCFLFTDLSNPTSNSIYQRVGYRPVADVNQWVFERP